MKSWFELKKYLRERKVGEFITRGEILRHNKDSNRYTTIDTYLNDLRNAGAITRVSRGVYSIDKRLSKNCTISSIRKFNNGDWKAWFCNELFEVI